MLPTHESTPTVENSLNPITRLKDLGHQALEGFLDRVANATAISKLSTGRDQISPFTQRELVSLSKLGILPPASETSPAELREL